MTTNKCRITAYVDNPLSEYLESFARSEGLSISQAVEKILIAFFDQSTHKEKLDHQTIQKAIALLSSLVSDTPVSHPESDTPVSHPESDTPVSHPESDTPVSHSESDTPVSHPESDTPVSHPESDTPVSHPESDTPVSHPESDTPHRKNKPLEDHPDTVLQYLYGVVLVDLDKKIKGFWDGRKYHDDPNRLKIYKAPPQTRVMNKAEIEASFRGQARWNDLFKILELLGYPHGFDKWRTVNLEKKWVNSNLDS